MTNIVKTYQGKLGTVTITKYEDGAEINYCVRHTHPAISASWYNAKQWTNAVLHAQFLAGKY